MQDDFLKNYDTDFNTVKPVYKGVEEKVKNSETLPHEVETVVIGGGLLGLSTALEIAEAGRKVIVLESNEKAAAPRGAVAASSGRVMKARSARCAKRSATTLPSAHGT